VPAAGQRWGRRSSRVLQHPRPARREPLGALLGKRLVVVQHRLYDIFGLPYPDPEALEFHGLPRRRREPGPSDDGIVRVDEAVELGRHLRADLRGLHLHDLLAGGVLGKVVVRHRDASEGDLARGLHRLRYQITDHDPSEQGSQLSGEYGARPGTSGRRSPR